MPDPQDTAQQPTAAAGPQAADTAAPAAATPESETTAEPAVAAEAPQAAAAAAPATPAAPVVPEPAPAVAADVPASTEAKPAGRRSAKAPITGPRVRVRQIGSPIGRRRDQRQTLIGLGLNKMHRVRELPDTPAVRGMLDKVRHLVEVESVG